MKTYHYTTLLLLITSFSFSQSWQWGKRGGSTDFLNTYGDSRQEEVLSIVTDSNKNSYILSSVGKNNLDIDGHPKTNFGDYSSYTDMVVASFSCDGSYRWSKVFGGLGFDKIESLQIDSQNNIYVAGRFGGCANANYPPRIDNDIILTQTPNEDCSLIFLTKLNSDGIMQWFRRPQQTGISVDIGYGHTSSGGLALDSAGNSYWLVKIPQGSYADGAFVNNLTGDSYYVLKYDTNGVFLNATPMDMQLGFSVGGDLQFFRNPNTGNYYVHCGLVLEGGPNYTVTLGGQSVTHTFFLAGFNAQGQFLWKKEDTSTFGQGVVLYNLVFDADNNIFLGGGIIGFSANTFLGLTVPEMIAPGFIMKVSPTADTVFWSSYNNVGSSNHGGIALNGNEIAYAGYGFGTDFTWGSQTLNISAPNEGYKALLARFNKNTGACTGLATIPSTIGFNDRGTALAVDASGDYILGGGFGYALHFDGNVQITNQGEQTDFFLAKYSTSACAPLAVMENSFPEPKVYPNPADTQITVAVLQECTFTIYNLTGNTIGKGNISKNANSIDISPLASGCYILQLENNSGPLKRIKLLKK